MTSRRIGIAVAGLLLLSACSVLAQDNTFPKVELAPEFEYIRSSPNFTHAFAVNGQQISGSNDFNCAGGGGMFGYNFTSLFGLTADLDYCRFFGNTIGLGNTITGNQFTYLFGPKLTFRNQSRFAPFLDLNFGGDRLSASCKNNAAACISRAGTGTYAATAFALTVGGGLDIRITRNFYLRPFQAEYLYTRFGNDCAAAVCTNNNNQNSFRLKSGIVIGWGAAPPLNPTASCSAQPSEVMVGEPVTVTANPSGFDPKHSPTYSWNSNGGKISGTGSTGSIDTNGVAGGSYTASVTITDPKLKKNNTASCSANFTVKEPPKNPPTMSCSASPASLQAGGSSTITCSCTSPDNVPVTVGSWTATSGSVSGSGNTGTLNTTGAPPGTITVTATCTDSRGLSTPSTTQATVENPPPPPPQAAKLTDCDFANMAKIKKPWRVDNECKGKLDDVAKNLQQNADNKLVIVGNADPSETRPNLAAERAVNSKAYLTSGEAQLGIDPNRIECRTGSAGTMTAEYWIVPAGATFSEIGTQPVDESQVKVVPDHAARKKAKAKQ